MNTTPINFFARMLASAGRLAILASLCSLQAQAAGKSTADGVFTPEQAKNGERAYQSNCATSHGYDLHSGDAEAPDLTEGPFKYAWGGRTIGDQFELIRSGMPFRNPRSLDDQTYLDIVTYILQFNGIPAGKEKLMPDLQQLKQITIEVPSD
jgi:cytochrome c